MKTLLILICFASISISVFAQCEMPFNEEGEYEYLEIVNLDTEYSSSDIYNSALISMTNLFKSVNDVIEVKNEDEGYIIGKFITVSKRFAMAQWVSHFRFSIRLDFKDNRYRILVNYLSHHAFSATAECDCKNNILSDRCGASCTTRAQWVDQCCEANSKVVLLVENLKEEIIENLEGDDW